MDTCLLKRALNPGICSWLSLWLLCSLSLLKRDLNYRCMNWLPAPDPKKHRTDECMCFQAGDKQSSDSANFQVSSFFFFFLAFVGIERVAGDTDRTVSWSTLTTLPPCSHHQVCICVWPWCSASICLIRGRSTNANKCCQMWKNHWPTWFHLVPRTLRAGWSQDHPKGLDIGRENGEEVGHGNMVTHWSS